MTWQGVPWAIGAHAGGQPETPAEAARTVAYLIGGTGSEGIAGPPDCAVLPREVPGTGVRIQPGVLVLLNRFPGGSAQAYVLRQPEMEDVPMTATSSGGARTDLIAVLVEDPQYAGQPAPLDAADGPYVRTVVYEGVSSTIRRLSEVAPNQTGYALARVTRPSSTGTVQTSHITDLRKLPRAKQSTLKRQVDVGDKETWDEVGGSWEKFPQAASWNVDIPNWATVAQLELRVSGAKVTNDGTDAGNWRGKARLKLGSLSSNERIIDPDIPNANKGNTLHWSAAGEVSIPEGMRGDTVSLDAQAIRESFSSGVVVREGPGTTVVAEVRFIEAPNLDATESFG